MRTLAACLLFALPILAQDMVQMNDAAIRTLQFVDENEGWAAGDDGVIWHTINGGKTWERQSSGIRASFRSMHFLTPYTGWIAGRTEMPGGGSAGVVMTTTDGGLTWTNVSMNAVPGLNYIKFFSERVGVAAGDGNEAFPGGLFTTLDGGRNWKPVPGTRTPSWLTGDFSDAETGVLAGAWNRLAPVRDGNIGMADVDSLSGRNVKGLKLNGDRAVAVGQGGLIMVSQNTAGVRWGFPDLKLPNALRAAIDFNAVAVSGSHVWAVGRPGSVVFHSADHGMTWDIQKTGQSLPLHCVHFADEKHGWAAGELGTILCTVDGGKTWAVQKQGGMRSAMMFVHTDCKRVPFDTVAAFAGEEGYFAIALGVMCPDPATLVKKYDSDAERIAAAMKAADPLRAMDGERLNLSMRNIGGAAGEVMWQFPTAGFQDGAEMKAMLDTWERRHGEKPAVAMLRQLVLAIRTWRPDIVVTDQPSDEATRVMFEVLRKAFEAAGDPEMFPEQIKELGLQEWGGKKLLVSLDKKDMAAVNVDVVSPLPRLGRSAGDFAGRATRLWNEEFPTRSFRMVATRLKDADGQTQMFQGVGLAPGGAARRELPALAEDDAKREEIKKAHEKKRNIQAVVDGKVGDIATAEQALSQLGDAVRDLPPLDAGHALYAAASTYAKAGKWSMAREAYMYMLSKYPSHPMGLEAARWLVRFHSSSEARRRAELGQFIEIAKLGFDHKERTTAPGYIPRAKTKDVLPPQTEVVQSTHRETIPAMVSARKWYEGALEFETRLEAHGSLFARDLPTNLCLAAARRQLGKAEESQRWLLRYITETTTPVGSPTTARGADPWRECVMLESWLINRAGQQLPPKPVAACKRSRERPTLDGKLDDACWADSIPMPLSTLAGELGTEFGCKEAIERQMKEGGKADPNALAAALSEGTRAAFSFDDENLYIAVVCRHPAGMKKAKVEGRSHDMDLRASDRVSLMIDLDRDYQTYYQFQIDQTGALAEDCWGDKSWNPKWFVAINSEENGWTAEVAIPLKELAGEVVTPGKLWAVNVVRTVPGKGIQAWSGPAGVTPRPEGMGVMTFVGPAAKK